jgi:flagellar FliJ protein
MPKFSFKLHALLRQRDLAEQECQRDFSVAQAAMAVRQAELKRLDEIVRLAVADLRQNQLVGQLNLSFLAAHRRFMGDMQRKGLQQLQKLDEADKRVKAARLRLIEATKQKKIIEKLRDRQQAAWAEAVARKETADMDEIATQMSTMTMREAWTGLDEAVIREPENRL